MPSAPFGSWPSPLTPELLAQASCRLGGGSVVNGVCYWTQSDPDQGGRVGLWRGRAGAEPEEVTGPRDSIGTRVNEYGGGDWACGGDVVVFSDRRSSAVMIIEDDAPARPLVAVQGLRFASLWLDTERRLLLAVREDHRGRGEPVQTIVGIDLDTDNAEGGRILAVGADFYAHPSLSPRGRLAWCQWNHPAMPWDSASIVVASLAEPGQTTVVDGGDEVSALYPAWAPDDALIYLCDASGYWNFRRWTENGVEVLVTASNDFCPPLWVLAPVPYSLIDATTIGCSWLADGRAKVGVLAFGEQGVTLTEWPLGLTSATLSGHGHDTIALLGRSDRPAELAELRWSGRELVPLVAAGHAPLPAEDISVAESMTWESPDGPVHAWYYPPKLSGWRSPDDDLPPVQVWSHGGPTAFSAADFSSAVQFWTTRGIGLLDVNYSGSSGFGRAYRERLNRRWGLSDVRDCARGAEVLVERGLADPRRLSIRGSSAGGFTTLAALTTTGVFTAGISLYGIADLESLVLDTHKFESRYLDRLVAPYPRQVAVYRERSPLYHLDRLNCPMLVLQGADDPVVPVNQALRLVEAVRSRGLRATLRVFEGEGHGFRSADTVAEVARQSLAFLAAVHGFTAIGGADEPTPHS